jgi:hypothetical protein
MNIVEMKFTVALTIAIRNEEVNCLQDAMLFRDNYNEDVDVVDITIVNQIYYEVSKYKF